MRAITTNSMLGEACNAAYLRMIEEPSMTSAAEKALEFHPHDGSAPEVIIYVKVIRFDADLLEREPDSGGLLAEI